MGPMGKRSQQPARRFSLLIAGQYGAYLMNATVNLWLIVFGGAYPLHRALR